MNSKRDGFTIRTKYGVTIDARLKDHDPQELDDLRSLYLRRVELVELIIDGLAAVGNGTADPDIERLGKYQTEALKAEQVLWNSAVQIIALTIEPTEPSIQWLAVFPEPSDLVIETARRVLAAVGLDDETKENVESGACLSWGLPDPYDAEGAAGACTCAAPHDGARCPLLPPFQWTEKGRLVWTQYTALREHGKQPIKWTLLELDGFRVLDAIKAEIQLAYVLGALRQKAPV